MAEREEGINTPAVWTGLGSLTASGALLLMVWQVQSGQSEMEKMLNQHGTELNIIRQSQTSSADSWRKDVTGIELEILRLERRVDTVERDAADFKRLMTDKNARPDAWGRSDDDRRMHEHTDEMRQWVSAYVAVALKPSKGEKK